MAPIPPVPTSMMVSPVARFAAGSSLLVMLNKSSCTGGAGRLDVDLPVVLQEMRGVSCYTEDTMPAPRALGQVREKMLEPFLLRRHRRECRGLCFPLVQQPDGDDHFRDPEHVESTSGAERNFTLKVLRLPKEISSPEDVLANNGAP